MEKYQRTRSIRFKLLPYSAKQIEKEILAIQNQDSFDLKQNCLDLVVKGYELYSELKTLIADKKYEDGNLKLKKDVEIKYTWLRLYTKTEYYDFQKSDNQNKKIFSLHEVNYLRDRFGRWFQEWKTNLGLLNNYIVKTTEEKHNLNRRAEIGKIIQSLSKRNSFSFIKEFISFAKFKNASNEKIKNLIERIDILLKLCEKGFLPTQSIGYPVACASLNYYTIFKNPKDFDEEIKRIQSNEIPKNILILIQQLEANSLDWNKISGIQGEVRKLSNNYKALLQVSTSMKLFKARAKTKFLEIIQKNQDLSFVKLQNHLLFSKFRIDNKSDKNKSQNQVFSDFIKLNRVLQVADNKINKLKQGDKKANEELEKAIKEKEIITKARGKYFTSLNNNKTYFKNYVDFCEAYRIVAQNFGRLNARLKGIEKEKIESQRLQYWSVIIEQNGKQYIAFIPKNNDYAKNAYEYYSSYNKSGNCKLFYFESMTHRALEKLYFTGIKEGTNKFYYGVKEDLRKQEYPQYYDEKGHFFDGEYFFNNNNGQKDEKKIIQFYKDILNTQYAKTVLKGVQWENLKDEVLNKQFDSFSDFKQTLERYSYTKIVKSDNNLLDELSKVYNAEIFEITSLDLNKNEKENLKEHTNVWLNFWNEDNETGNYPIRINPQMTISWRNSKLSREVKYGENSELFDENKKNRYLHPQYTLTTTITENAANQNMNFAFKDANSKKEQIDKFNSQLFETFNPKYSYGIDMGEIELATLSLIKKVKDKVLPQLFEVYELKNLDYYKKGYIYNDKKELIIREKPYRAVENLSYFLNKKLYDKTFRDDKFQEIFDTLFEKKTVSSIDLTIAKVVSDKIITNGDIITFLNLKILNAKRKIYQELIKNPKAVLEEINYKLYYSDQKEKIKIYISQEKFEIIRPYEQIKKDLLDYHSNAKKNIVHLEENINKMRKSLVGNMIGVISYLYRIYQGIITMENLNQNTVESHRKLFEGDLTRPLEFALYNKFIKANLVPPILGEIVQLREQKSTKISQVGIINFVSEQDTSLTCPNCGKKVYKSSNDEKYTEDKKNRVFHCKKCGFHNKDNPMGLESLDSNDKVAAFNIAKRGFENFKNFKKQK
jgi:predicted RNA-binding Zn-ribbon protein involved in translation (DUF1610 family)